MWEWTDTQMVAELVQVLLEALRCAHDATHRCCCCSGSAQELLSWRSCLSRPNTMDQIGSAVQQVSSL